jgi:hypothetical protein
LVGEGIILVGDQQDGEKKVPFLYILRI